MADRSSALRLWHVLLALGVACVAGALFVWWLSRPSETIARSNMATIAPLLAAGGGAALILLAEVLRGRDRRSRAWPRSAASGRDRTAG